MAKRGERTISRIAFCLLCFIVALSTCCMAQQRAPFSDKKVEVDGRLFMPFTKGEVERKISGTHQPWFDEVCSIICSWDSITPPQGLKVACYGSDNALEIYFLPYLFEDGVRFASESGPNLRIFVNSPFQMFGSPVVDGIFLCPKKRADFNGYPIYQNDRGEVTIVCKKSDPLFIPVSQEEYLRALIANEEKKAPQNINADNQAALREMERAYQELLKIDKEAAKEFKQHLDDFATDANNAGNGSGMPDMVTSLKNELSALSTEERSKQACYGGASAMERYHNASGLVRDGNSEDSEVLVKPNPALIDPSPANQIQLLVISWSVGDGENVDKPRFYNEGGDGFNLADYLMSKLYNNQRIWSRILAL